MFPTAPIQTAPDTTSLVQGGVSTSFATVTKTATTTAKTTATDTIVKTAHRASTGTVFTATRYTVTHLCAIIPQSLLKNVTAAYNLVDKQNATAETYAIKYALGAVLTSGVALAWHIRKTPPPPTPPGVDRQRWKAVKRYVHNWLHEKLRSNAELRKELASAKNKLEDYEMSWKSGVDHESQSEKLSGEARLAWDGGLQPTMDFNKMSNEAILLHQELMAEKDKATKQAVGSGNIARARDAQERTSYSGRENSDLYDAEAKMATQDHIAEQGASQSETKLADEEKELQAAQAENERLNHKFVSQNIRLQEAQKEVEEDDTRAFSLKRELGETRLEHSKQVASLQKQLQNQRQPVEEKVPLADEEKDVDERLQAELEFQKEELESHLQRESARCDALEDEVEKLNFKTTDLEKRLQDNSTSREILETEVKKLKSEIDMAKANETVAPPPKSFTSSETQTSSVATSLQDLPSHQSNRTLHSPPHLLSVTGGTIPSTPRPSNLQATPSTTVTTSSPELGYTPEHVTLTQSWNSQKIQLSVYREGMLALAVNTRPLKRKPGDFTETPRPIKKPRPGKETTNRPIASVLTPGGGPALKLPKHASDGEADGMIVLDRRETLKALQIEKIKTSAADLNGAHLSVTPKQETVELDKSLLGDISAIITNTDTKRKLGVDDDEASPKPSQMLRTREDLGNEQTSSLNKLIPKPVINTVCSTANTSSTSRGPGDGFPVQGPVTHANDGIVFNANGVAELNDSNPSKEIVAIVENKDPPPKVQSASVEPAEPDGDIAMADSDKAEAASTTGVAKPASVQASRRKSRLPNPSPSQGTRKSSRNARKLTVSLNERDLSRRPASLQKDIKALAASLAKPSAKPRASSSPSKSKKTK